MTVRELIEKLETLDKDSRITVYSDGGYGGGWDFKDIQKITSETEDETTEKIYVIY